jgi:hypothetical protein
MVIALMSTDELQRFAEANKKCPPRLCCNFSTTTEWREIETWNCRRFEFMYRAEHEIKVFVGLISSLYVIFQI